MFDLKLITLPPSSEPVSPKFNDIEVVDYDLLLLDGVRRKTQDILKILLTRVTANLIFPNYGSELPNVVGSRATLDVVDRISDSIVKAMGYLQAMETSTKPDERLKRILYLNVVDGADPREKVIRLIVEMEDGSTATTNVPLATGV
jgi:hypothetical protein